MTVPVIEAGDVESACRFLLKHGISDDRCRKFVCYACCMFPRDSYRFPPKTCRVITDTHMRARALLSVSLITFYSNSRRCMSCFCKKRVFYVLFFKYITASVYSTIKRDVRIRNYEFIPRTFPERSVYAQRPCPTYILSVQRPQ